jgi:two-component system, LytTR family, sensor kinase
MNTYNIIDNGFIEYFFGSTSSREELIDNKNNLKRKKIYWISQIIGWFLFGAANIIINSSLDGFTINNVFIWTLVLCTGILFTHIFRFYIKKWHWLDLPLNKIIPQVLLSSVIIGILLFIVLYLSHAFIGRSIESEFKLVTPIMGIINLSSIILFWTLIYFSVHYFENYKKAEIESYIWEAAVKDFELKTLKSQLNPHFMFNALNSIRALIEEDPESAKTAVTKLSNILRYSLTMERIETIPLEDEMKAVSDYLSLEKIRFEERLKFDINISSNSHKIEIPPMMIQTLVENGIKHGISKITGGGEISICSSLMDSDLHIKIKNSGQINEDMLKHSKGFGISNTKHRLNLLYGESASFTIKNDSGKEVIAEIIIPTGGVKNESINYR